MLDAFGLVPPGISVSLDQRTAWIEEFLARIIHIKKDTYLIQMNSDEIETCFSTSGLDQQGLSLEQHFVPALQIHEIGHILAGSLPLASPFRDKGLWHHIWNILEDARMEYVIAYQYPAVLSYLRVALAAIRPKLVMSHPLLLIPNGKAQKIEQCLHDLFLLARYGVLRPEADQEFCALLLPLLLSSMRGGKENTEEIATRIYWYLMALTEKSMPLQNDLNEARAKEQVYEQGEREQDQQGTTPVLPGNQQPVEKMIEELLQEEQKAEQEEVQGGKTAGEALLQIQERPSDQTYARTIKKYQAEILELTSLFSLLFGKKQQVSSYEGALRAKYQQRAYVESLSGEVSKILTRTRKLLPSVELLISRDTSGSTKTMKQAYVEAVIILLAALEEAPGVTTGALDFAGSAAWTKLFSEGIMTGRFYPQAEGGTVVLAAVQEAEKYEWQAQYRLHLILSDGDFLSDATPFQMIREQEEVHTLFLDVQLAPENSGEMVTCAGEQFFLHRCSTRELASFLYEQFSSEIKE